METIELILEIFKPIFKFLYLTFGLMYLIKWGSESKWLRHREYWTYFIAIATFVIWYWVAFPMFPE